MLLLRIDGLSILGAGVCIFLAAGSASAHDLCDEANTPQQGISTCTRQIEAGQFKGRDLAITYVNRGVAFHRLKQYAKAVADFDKALKIAPRLPQAWNNRAVAKQAMGKPKAAIADYSKAIDLNPRYAAAWYGRGSAHEALKDNKAARRDYRQYLRLAPGDPAGRAALERVGAK